MWNSLGICFFLSGHRHGLMQGTATIKGLNFALLMERQDNGVVGRINVDADDLVQQGIPNRIEVRFGPLALLWRKSSVSSSEDLARWAGNGHQLALSSFGVVVNIAHFSRFTFKENAPAQGLGDGDRLVWRPHAAYREDAKWPTRRCRLSSQCLVLPIRPSIGNRTMAFR
jgi:hypothetical protein